ncbi:BTB/POZ domain-containing protein 6-like [Clytia hemisphaerica]|uniref:BTB domain-containing protein n=1 Tax=Clytia hemisphaerica TaxID=252671 RepID=A0A7M5WZA9_9CNID|eukprot:TCONS_00010400-protein
MSESPNAHRNIENPPQWQTTKTNVKGRNEHMYLNSLISDVQFCIGKKTNHKKTIPAHKFVLGTSSPVFFAMLYGEFSKTDIIEIEDCETEAFLELLRFIYYDEVHLTGQNVVDVLYLANKYIVPVLSKECVNYLLDNVQTENVLSVLNAAVCFGESRLEKHCWSILSRRTTEILASDSFIDIDRQLLVSVLQKDNLNVCEIDVFNSVKRWAEAECSRKELEINIENQKVVLESLLYLIRFPVMTAKEFALGPARSELLPLEDVKSIFIYLNSNVKEKSLKYPLTRREFKPHCCSRYVKPMKNYLWRYDEKDTDAIRFKADQEIFLAGIGLYGSPCGGEYTVSVEIVIESEPVHKHSSSFTCPPYPEMNPIENPPIHSIMFDDPLRIKEETYYDIFVLLDGPPSFAGDDGRQNVTEEGVNFVFENSSGSTNGTSFDEGQIPTLLFYF